MCAMRVTYHKAKESKWCDMVSISSLHKDIVNMLQICLVLLNIFHTYNVESVVYKAVDFLLIGFVAHLKR